MRLFFATPKVALDRENARGPVTARLLETNTSLKLHLVNAAKAEMLPLEMSREEHMLRHTTTRLILATSMVALLGGTAMAETFRWSATTDPQTMDPHGANLAPGT